MTKNKVIQQQWIEAPAVSPLTVYQRGNVQIINERPIQSLTEDAAEAVLCILFDILEQPVHQLDVLEITGSMALVSLTPWQRVDPVVPVPLKPFGSRLNNWRFRRNYRALISHLTSEIDTSWGKRGKNLLEKLIYLLRQEPAYTATDRLYFQRNVMLSLAHPTRAGKRVATRLDHFEAGDYT